MEPDHGESGADDGTAAQPVLRLRIPDPTRGWDPSERVRRHLNTSVEVRKPALDEKVERIALMRKQLVQVLGDDGHAHGEWTPDLSTAELVTGLRDMMLV